MVPILYKGDETNFNHNGLGLLKDTISCEVTEVRNGIFDLELVYPITGPLFKNLINNNIIRVKPNDKDDLHNFRIKEIDKTLSDYDVTVYATSITNDLGGNLIRKMSMGSVTPQVIMNEMKKNLHYPTNINFSSNIETEGDINWELNNPLNLIVGVEGSLVDIFGGEVKRTDNVLHLYGRRGGDNVTTIRARKNLSGFNMTESFQGKYTQILPYFKYEEEIEHEHGSDVDSNVETSEVQKQEVVVFGDIVTSKYHGRYPVNNIKPVDFSQNEKIRESKSKEDLNKEASRYFTHLYPGIDQPSVNIKVDMIQLVDSEEYEMYKRLEQIELTDTVTVYVPEYDIDILVKITELKYDVLREQTIKLVAGSSSRTSLMDSISGEYKKFTSNLVDEKVQKATSGIINDVLTQKDGTNVFAGRSNPPAYAKQGDIWFKDVGGGDVEMYEFDGTNWIRKMYKGFGEDIKTMVETKIAESEEKTEAALVEHDKKVKNALDLAKTTKDQVQSLSNEAKQIKDSLPDIRTSSNNALQKALEAVNESKDVKRRLLEEVNSSNAKHTDLMSRVSKIDNDIQSVATDLGTEIQNQSNSIRDFEGRIVGFEDRISKQRVGSRNLLIETRTNSGIYSEKWSKTGETYLDVEVVRFNGREFGLTNPVRVYKDVEYTFSVYYKFSNDSTGRLAVFLNKWGSRQEVGASFSQIRNTIHGDVTNLPTKDKWRIHTVTFKALTNGYIFPRIEKTSGQGYLYIGPRQLEEGNVPTQWHPNEEDVSKEEMVYRRGISETLSQYSSTTRDIQGNIRDAQTRISQNASKIEQKADLVEFNRTKDSINNLSTRITQTAEKVESKADKTALDNLNRTVTQQQTSLSQTNDRINAKADKTFVDNINSKVSKQQAEIELQAGTISSKASKSDIDDLLGKINSANTRIDQTARDISIKANSTDITEIRREVSSKIDSTQANNIVNSAKSDLKRQIDSKPNSSDISNAVSAAEGRLRNEISTKTSIQQVNAAITAGTNGILQEVNSLKGVLDGGISARNYAVNTATPVRETVDSRPTNPGETKFVVKNLYSTPGSVPLRDLDFVVGETYSVMFDIYAEENKTFRNFRVEGYTERSYKHLVGAITDRIGTRQNPLRFFGSFTIPDDSHLDVRRWTIRVDNAQLNLVVKNFRIFKGSVKQDWYPAWEDQKNNIEEAKARIDISDRKIENIVSLSRTLPDGTPNQISAKIGLLENSINQRVTSQELLSKGYQTRSDIDNAINSRTDLAKKTDLPTSIGGRNMATRTSNSWSQPKNNFNGTENQTVTISEQVFTYGLLENDTVNVYVELERTNVAAVSGKVATAKVQGYGNVTVWSPSMPGSGNIDIAGSGITTFRYSFRVNRDHLRNVFWNVQLRFDNVYSGSVRWRLLKIEKGPFWTSWSPAPEDTDTSLNDRLRGYVTNETYSQYVADRRQTDRQIEEKITSTVSKVPTGPVNLIVNGMDQQYISPWRAWDSSKWILELTSHGFFYNGKKKLLRFKTNSSTEKGTFESGVFNLKRNTKYTIRLGVFANGQCKPLRFALGRGNSPTEVNNYDAKNMHDWFTGSPSRLEYKTLTVDSGPYDYGKITFDHQGTKNAGSWADAYIAEISVIEGEFNNSWTPSFDELITKQKFNETKNTVDSFVRAIGTRDSNNVIPNITRQIITSSAFVNEVIKNSESENNLLKLNENGNWYGHEHRSGISEHFSSINYYIGFGAATKMYVTGQTTRKWFGITNALHVDTLSAGTTLTIRFDFLLDRDVPLDDQVVVELKDHTNGTVYWRSEVANPNTQTNRMQTFQRTFTIDRNIRNLTNPSKCGFYIWIAKNGYIEVYKPMVVKGPNIGIWSVSPNDSLSSRVEQTANAYAVKFLNSAGDITTQLNLAPNSARIKSSLIHLDGNVTVSGTSWLDGAVIRNLDASKITAGTIDANRVRITNLTANMISGFNSEFIRSTIGKAYIDWLKGSMITSKETTSTLLYQRTDSGHIESHSLLPKIVFDLDKGNLTLNGPAEIRFNSWNSSLVRRKGWNTSFIQFADAQNNDGLYIGMGVTSGGDGVNSMSSGRFAGIRVFRTSTTKGKDHGGGYDATEIYGDIIQFKHGFDGNEGFYMEPTKMNKRFISINNMFNAIESLKRCWIHLANVGWNTSDHNFTRAVKDEIENKARM